MQKGNLLKSCCKINCHSVLDTESSTHDVSQRQQPRQTWKTLKQVQGDNPIFNNNKAFTLIELLVVVLIIGILAAVALPQYQKAVEKSRMTEAVSIVRTLANANKLFYMTNGRWAEHNELDLLDVEIPGSVYTYGGGNRIQTKYFIYSPNGTTEEILAMAQRVPFNSVYTIFISRAEPDRIQCHRSSSASAVTTEIQKKLCQELNTKGTL